MSVMMRFAGSDGSTAKKIFPAIFSYAPTAPKIWPPARSLRDWISTRTTSAAAGAAIKRATMQIPRRRINPPIKTSHAESAVLPACLEAAAERVGADLVARRYAHRLQIDDDDVAHARFED